MQDVLVEAEKLHRQYRTIPALDKSKEMLIAKYGEHVFAELRREVAKLIVGHSSNDSTSLKSKKVIPGSLTSPKNREGKWLVFGTERIDGTKADSVVADHLLRIFGDIEIVHKYEPYLSRKLSEKRCSAVMAIAESLYSSNGEYYRRLLQSQQEIQKTKEDMFVQKVIEQNNRFNNHKPKYSSIGKIILIASGNKR